MVGPVVQENNVPQLRAFLLTTSIKGVPRLAKAKHPLFRTLWAVFVMSGSAITLCLVTQLFITYLANDVTVEVREIRDTSINFPAITLCNLNPMANTNVTLEHLKNYFEMVRKMGTSGKLHKGNLFDPATLYANMAPYINNDTARQFLVACQWNLRQDGDRPCLTEEVGQMFIYQARLGYCLTFTPPTSLDFVVGFSAILYLDDSLEFTVPFYKLTMNTPVSVGAFLVVHQRHTLPDLSHGTVLLPGRNTHVNIRVKQRIRQPHPYSNCTSQAMLPQAPEYHYTQRTCLDLCTQTSIIDSCGCISEQALYVPTLKGYRGQPLCGVISRDNLSMALNEYIKEQRCIRSVLSCADQCDQHCPAACEEEQYIPFEESTLWPHTALRLAFWKEYVRNKPYSYRFDCYHDMQPSLNDTSNERARKLKQIENDNILTDNFLQVSRVMWFEYNTICLQFILII